MPPISIIALGKDAIAMSTLMNAFRVYAERFYTPFGDLKIERSHRIWTMVEANSLLMATNGVCFIGDWSSYKPSCSAYVKNGKSNGAPRFRVATKLTGYRFSPVSSGFETDRRWCTNEHRFPVEMCHLVVLVLLRNEKIHWKCAHVFRVNIFIRLTGAVQVTRHSNGFILFLLVFLAFLWFSTRINQTNWSKSCWLQAVPVMR